MTEKYSGLRECLDDHERLGNTFFIWSVELARALLAERDALIVALEDLTEAGEEAWGSERPCVRIARAALQGAQSSTEKT